jgi:hypothetical protein
LVIKDELGGEIVRTKVFKPEENLQQLTGTVKLNSTGGMKADLHIDNFGVFFNDSYRLAQLDSKKLDKYYKESLAIIADAVFSNIKFKTFATEPKFSEEFQITSANFVEKAGEYTILHPTSLIEPVFIPKRLRNRKTAFVIEEPEIYKAEIKIVLAENQDWDELPQDIKLESDFGAYNLSFKKIDQKTCVVHRTFSLNKGKFQAAEFEKYRKFLEQVSKADQNKLIIKIN